MTSCDAIVIGGGHNGLTAAAVLAGSGRRTLLLEAGDRVGGMAGGVSSHAPPLATLVNGLDRRVIEALDLRDHGLDAMLKPVDTVSLSHDGHHLVLEGSGGRALSGLAATEAAAWDALRHRLSLQASILGRFLTETPPQAGGVPRSLAMTGAAAALALRRAGVEELREFGRMALMPVADILDEELGDDRLKGLLAFDATLGIRLGPRSPTSIFGFYRRLATQLDGKPCGQAVAAGGMAALAAAFHAAAEVAGVTVRTQAEVGRIVVRDDRATGVELVSGETIAAPLVVSATSPVTTLLRLVGNRHLDAGMVRELTRLRIEGNVARVTLALSAPPQFPGLPEARHGDRLVWAPSARHVDTQFNAQKYGDLPSDPPLEILVPDLARPGGPCTVCINVANVPYRLSAGWDAGRTTLLERVLSRLETLAPGIRKSVSTWDVLAPPDIEREFRVPGGHWHHVEWQVDRLFSMRPVLGAGGYRTPIAGLWLTGAGTHPGGGISGLPGLNTARAIIARGDGR